MKLAIDGVFYVREGFDFEKVFKEILTMLKDVRILSVEYPELALIAPDGYYYRCGFMLDKPLEEKISEEEIKEIKRKIEELFKGEIIYTLTCEILGEEDEGNSL
ncbi:hypothetical protein J422_04233 [Methanocaldococcus villosus KIN24-T80]|uniref:Uncharacterized protein n=1 Tax=Methanocaldococcus villosus KIN24-T80 TaxID=1069083 RepID=N6V195_9EURY|nr:hypothetical protein [Methanocaldococcus villosus]ENN96048.1 hypothetical protein J422_04233 [Methanocaldococcus villosus KIN24-T80]